MHAQLFSKMDYSLEAYGTALVSPILGWCPLLFNPEEPSCTCAVSPLPQGWEIWDLLILYSNRV